METVVVLLGCCHIRYLGDDDKAVAHAKGVMAASYLDAPATAIYRKSHAKALVARLLALGGYRYDD